MIAGAAHTYHMNLALQLYFRPLNAHLNNVDPSRINDPVYDDITHARNEGEGNIRKVRIISFLWCI